MTDINSTRLTPAVNFRRYLFIGTPPSLIPLISWAGKLKEMFGRRIFKGLGNI
jgi:hypothetical protein